MAGIRGADIDCQKLAKGRGVMYNGIAVRVTAVGEEIKIRIANNRWDQEYV